MELRPQIFFYLKSNGPSPLSDLVHNIPGFTATEVTREVEELIGKKLLRKDSDNLLRICLYLDAPRKEYRTEGLYNYQTVQEKMPIDPAQSRPPIWMNENVYLIPQRDQGERGTCVGQATAYAADLNAIKLTEWRPDLSTVKRNIIIDNGTVKFIKDNLPPGCASAECAYVQSRETGGIRRDQYGSFLDFSVDAWRKKGICTDTLWWNPKTANFDNYDAYPTNRDKAASQASLHVIEGYAMTKDFESIKDAIYKNGFVLMAINVFDNWMDNDCKGVFPDPKGNSIGSHALCWVGYDVNNLYCIHSWAGWSLLGGISKAYYDIAHCTAFTPLDEHETSVAKDTYVKLTVTTDVLCDIQVGKDTYRKTKKVVGAFEPGTTLNILATPSGGNAGKGQVILVDKDTEINFAFLTTHVAYVNNIWARIKSFLEALWK